MESKSETKLNHHHDHPSNRTDDALHLFKVFPEDVWRSILKYADGASYHKICGASTLFETLLSPQRIHILLVPVLEILMDYYQKRLWETPSTSDKEEDSDSDSDDENDENYQFRQLLNLRLVCRSWKNRVNHYLQNLPCWYHKSYNYYLDKPEQLRSEFMDEIEKYFTEFEVGLDFSGFHNKFKDSHFASVNPLPARRIHIDLGYMSDPRDLRANFYTEFLQWLHQYGQHVWHFNLDMDPYSTKLDQAEFYYRLKDMLELLPNLKSFRFLCNSHIPVRPMPENQLKDLVSSYQNIEISRHLNHFTLRGMPILLAKQLFDKPRNLTNQLRISFDNEQDFWQFFDGGRVPVQKPDIDLPQSINSISDLGPMFSAMETCFGEGLEDLEIWLPKNVPFLPNERLQFPKLKKLQVYVQDEGAALAMDFLLNMADHLENISLILKIPVVPDIVQFQKQELEHEVKFYQHLNQPHQSNVWEKFPKLKWVKIWTPNASVPDWDCKREQRKAEKQNK